MESSVRAYISWIKELTYALSQLHHEIEHQYNLDNKRYISDYNSSLWEPQ